jgi:hypothetical protein
MFTHKSLSFLKKTTLATLCFECGLRFCAIIPKELIESVVSFDKVLLTTDYITIAKIPAITPKRATPSTRAAAKIMLERISPLTSG